MQFSRRNAPLLGMAAVAALGLVAPRPASAQSRTFELTYSGAYFNNTAAATAVVTIDESQLQNPGFTEQDLNPFVTAFTITVSGAKLGNGTFGLSDYVGGFDVSGFDGFELDTNGGTLDLTKELIGQPTAGDPYGTTFHGNSGDFAITVNDVGELAGAPNAGDVFQIYTNSGLNGFESLHLTSFRPAPAAVPEASMTVSLGLLLALGMGGLVIAGKRKRKV